MSLVSLMAVCVMSGPQLQATVGAGAAFPLAGAADVASTGVHVDAAFLYGPGGGWWVGGFLAWDRLTGKDGPRGYRHEAAWLGLGGRVQYGGGFGVGHWWAQGGLGFYVGDVSACDSAGDCSVTSEQSLGAEVGAGVAFSVGSGWSLGPAVSVLAPTFDGLVDQLSASASLRVVWGP